MGVLGQRIGPAQHERRAVQHIVGVEDPRRRHVHDVALEDFDANNGHQRDNQPGRSLTNPCADAVDRVQKTLDVHVLRPLSVRVLRRYKAPSGRTTEWCFAGSGRRQVFFATPFGPK